MTKQEEIREYIKSVLYQMNTEVTLESGRSYNYYLNKILGYLHSQRVVIETKPDWCPAHGYPLPCFKCGAPKGITVYEPLIEKIDTQDNLCLVYATQI